MDASYIQHIAYIQKDHWWYNARRDILKRMIEDLDLPDGPQILEVGCGTGANLGMLRKFGALSAMDTDEVSVNYAREHNNQVIIEKAPLPIIPFEVDFDLICAFDVLEHIEDDHRAMTSIYDQTKKGGYALLTVPAHPWLWSAHDEINHHKRRYTIRNFRTLLRKSGFGIQKISYYNTFLFAPVAAKRLIDKHIRKTESHDMELPPPVVNTALEHIFAAERFILPHFNFPFGVSLIAVCRKI